MGGLFDFSKPAEKAKEQLISSAKKSMILTLVVGVLLALVMLVTFADLGEGLIGFIAAVIIIVISISIAIATRNSTFYRLAILEACEVIKKTSGM